MSLPAGPLCELPHHQRSPVRSGARCWLSHVSASQRLGPALPLPQRWRRDSPWLQSPAHRQAAAARCAGGLAAAATTRQCQLETCTARRHSCCLAGRGRRGRRRPACVCGRGMRQRCRTRRAAQLSRFTTVPTHLYHSSQCMQCGLDQKPLALAIHERKQAGNAQMNSWHLSNHKSMLLGIGPVCQQVAANAASRRSAPSLRATCRPALVMADQQAPVRVAESGTMSAQGRKEVGTPCSRRGVQTAVSIGSMPAAPACGMQRAPQRTHLEHIDAGLP